MIVFLSLVVGALAVAVGVLIYQRMSAPVAAPRQSSGLLGSLLRGYLAAQTGGATLALGAGRSGGGILSGGQAGAA